MNILYKMLLKKGFMKFGAALTFFVNILMVIEGYLRSIYLEFARVKTSFISNDVQRDATSSLMNFQGYIIFVSMLL